MWYIQIPYYSLYCCKSLLAPKHTAKTFRHLLLLQRGHSTEDTHVLHCLASYNTWGVSRSASMPVCWNKIKHAKIYHVICTTSASSSAASSKMCCTGRSKTRNAVLFVECHLHRILPLHLNTVCNIRSDTTLLRVPQLVPLLLPQPRLQ